ncbi:Peptidyl-prolyl cis-trans isomerase PASTICCINO1 [Platanthera guangdongensis]|uniref:peptidylprolyl isomerase n=1 Tax=Platanthera guangdongensis TaxID=2320717 RepID=A0ABR2LQG7_9ASPA
MDCPLQDSLLRVFYKGMILNEEKTVFYDTQVDNNGEPLEFCSGEGLVPEGFEMSVRLMLPGEISLVTCPPDYAYDRFERPANVPEGAYVQWEIELVGFETPKDWTGLNFQNIMDEVVKIKSTGNRLFNQGKYELAKAKYDKVLREYNHVNPQDDEEGKTFLNSRNTLHLNVAACFQKMGEYRKSIETCNKVLDANPVNVKALYRRGTAYMLSGDFEEARKDFNAMISMDKSSEPDANAALQKLKQKELEVEKKDRKQFKGLFDKKPGEISEVGTSSIDDQILDTLNPDADSINPEKETRTNRADSVSAGEYVEAERISLLDRLWPAGRRFCTALGLNRCSIL